MSSASINPTPIPQVEQEQNSSEHVTLALPDVEKREQFSHSENLAQTGNGSSQSNKGGAQPDYIFKLLQERDSLPSFLSENKNRLNKAEIDLQPVKIEWRFLMEKVELQDAELRTLRLNLQSHRTLLSAQDALTAQQQKRCKGVEICA